MLKPVIAKKQADVNVLNENIRLAKLVILFEYQGMTVSDLTQLRILLRKSQSMIKLYHNNIIKRAFKNTIYYNEMQDFFQYPRALMFSQDESFEPIKVFFNFAKQNKFLKIIVGIVENKVLFKDQIQALAVLPSKEVLLSMLSAGMLMPVTQLAMSLELLCQQKK